MLFRSYESTLPLVTDKVIDPCVFRLADGTWRLWYNNERAGKSTYYADSPDLFTWTDKGSAHLPRDRGEALLRRGGRHSEGDDRAGDDRAGYGCDDGSGAGARGAVGVRN